MYIGRGFFTDPAVVYFDHVKSADIMWGIVVPATAKAIRAVCSRLECSYVDHDVCLLCFGVNKCFMVAKKPEVHKN